MRPLPPRGHNSKVLDDGELTQNLNHRPGAHQKTRSSDLSLVPFPSANWLHSGISQAESPDPRRVCLWLARPAQSEPPSPPHVHTRSPWAQGEKLNSVPRGAARELCFCRSAGQRTPFTRVPWGPGGSALHTGPAILRLCVCGQGAHPPAGGEKWDVCAGGYFLSKHQHANAQTQPQKRWHGGNTWLSLTADRPTPLLTLSPPPVRWG